MDLQECRPVCVDITDGEAIIEAVSSEYEFVIQRLRSLIFHLSSECFSFVCIYCGSEQNIARATGTKGMHRHPLLLPRTRSASGVK